MDEPTPAPDLHVRSLGYSVESSLTFSPMPMYPANFGGDDFPYVDPPPLDFERQGVKFRLAAGQLTCEMKTHFANVEAARAVVEPILRAWEVISDLKIARGEIRFHFASAELQPSGVTDGVIVQPASVVATAIAGKPTVHVGPGEYPAPAPDTFRVNPDVEDAVSHYHAYLDGRERFLDMAYYCLTLIKKKGGGSFDGAANLYRIDKHVLRLISGLSSTRGDRRTARKADSKGPLTDAESAWLDAAIRVLIGRLGDTRPAAELELIRMSDLPSL